jgi:hypothetical protein
MAPWNSLPEILKQFEHASQVYRTLSNIPEEQRSQYRQYDMAWVLFIMINANGGFLKIAFNSLINIDKLLRIPVHQREPAAL